LDGQIAISLRLRSPPSICSPAEKVHGLGSVCCRQRQIARRDPTGRQITKLALFLDLAEAAQTLSEPDPDRLSEELRE
jgi:hypothetical protein